MSQNITTFTVITVPDNEITKLSNTLVEGNYKIIKLSDIAVVIHPSITMPSWTRIKALGQEFTKVSDTIVRRSEIATINKLSDTFVILNPSINITSDAVIHVLYEMSAIPSDSFIIGVTDIQKTANTVIFKAAQSVIKESRSAVYIEAYDTKTKVSDTTIRKTTDLPIFSDSSIRRDRSNIIAIMQKDRQL